LYVLVDAVAVNANVNDEGGGERGTRVQFSYNGTSFVVWPDGRLTLTDGGVVEGDFIDAPEGVSVWADNFNFIVRFPHHGTVGDTARLFVETITGSAQSPAGHAWNGSLTFREELGLVNAVRADAAPVSMADPVWADAAVTLTATGSGASSADVRTLWVDGGAGISTLYALVDVADFTPDSTGGDAHERDSIEIFLSLMNNRASAYDALYDTQLRIGRNGEVSIGGPAHQAIHRARLNVIELVDNGTAGWSVMVGVRLGTDTGHLQGQWNDNFGSLGDVFGFDLQVNDAVGGTRVGTRTISDPTGTSWMSTYRWGVLRLVDSATDDGGEAPVEPELPAHVVIEFVAPNGQRLRSALYVVHHGNAHARTGDFYVRMPGQNNGAIVVRLTTGEWVVRTLWNGNNNDRITPVVGLQSAF
jgi:endo-1,4-beta-xylanase